MTNNQVQFPLKNPERYGDVRTMAERAGIELRNLDGEEGIPFCCNQRMQVKGGVMGPDYARCGSCGNELYDLASPHINGGIIWAEDVMEQFGDQMWTTKALQIQE